MIYRNKYLLSAGFYRLKMIGEGPFTLEGQKKLVYGDYNAVDVLFLSYITPHPQTPECAADRSVAYVVVGILFEIPSTS